MALVTVQGVAKEYSTQQVLRGVNFQISAGQKLGLIGPNGSGKTTLIRIILGQENPSDGSVALSPGARIGYVPQIVNFEKDQSVEEFILADYLRSHDGLRRQEEALAQAQGAEVDRALKNYQRARDEYDHQFGDRYPQRVMEMLSALGLEGQIKQKVQALSGGEKNVLSLTQALLAEPNLLILDEPGNHLDFLGLAWLERFLIEFRGAVLIVSHNRYLLDRVVNGILALEGGRVRYYGGNYSESQETRLQELLAQQADYNANQKRLERLEKAVKKFADIARDHSNPKWGKLLRSRRTQLTRAQADAVEKPVFGQRTIRPEFAAEATRGDIALAVRDYTRGFGERTLLENAELDMACGERLALVGPNGSGKTTLLRDIVRTGSWENPVLRVGPSLTIGFLAQEQEELESDHTILEELTRLPNVGEKLAISMLARFLFRADQTWKKVRELSGGERNRLQLARLMLLKPNFLILDEPTNHLDIQTCEAVEEALAEFEGTLLVVSHDRYFLDKIVNKVAEVRDRKLHPYDGNFTNFWYTRQEEDPGLTGRINQRHRIRAEVKTEPPKEKPSRPRSPQPRPEKPKKSPKAILDLESRILELEENKTRLEAQVAQAFTAGNHQEGTRLSLELQEIQDQIARCYDEWLDKA